MYPILRAQRAALTEYPILHPVMLKVFENPEIEIVRSSIPVIEPGLT